MMNFTYASEWAFTDYLQNNITGSLIYPIRVGHTTGSLESFDNPVIAVILENRRPVMDYVGIYEASLRVDIVNNAHDPNTFDQHNLASNEIERLMVGVEAQENMASWINSDSSSLFIAGVPLVDVTNGMEGNNFVDSYRFTVNAQQNNPSTYNVSFGVQ
jgi:hypothetical protein